MMQAAPPVRGFIRGAVWLCLVSGVLACQPPGEPLAQPERPDAARTSVDVSPAGGARANGQDTLDIRVTVRGAEGSPLKGLTVTVAASGEGNTLTQPSGPTTADGVALARLVSTVPGPKTVTATVHAEDGPLTLSSRPTVEFLAVSTPHLAFTSAPSSGVAGMGLGTFELTLQDERGQTLTGAQATVTVALGVGVSGATLQGTLSVAAVRGVARFPSLRLEKAAPGYTLVASAPGLAPATSTPFEVRHAEAARFALTPPPGTVTASTLTRIGATAFDAFGNTASGYTGTVRVTSNDPSAVLPANYTFTPENQGHATFHATLAKAGPGSSVTVTDTARPALTGSLVFPVEPGTAARLEWTQPSPQGVAGTPVPLTLTAYDAQGNVATGYTGTVHFASTEGSDVLPAAYTFTPADQGRHAFSLTATKARTRRVSAADRAVAALTHTADLEVVAAAPAVLTFSRQPTSRGVRRQFPVEALLTDVYGNASTASSPVVFTVNRGTLAGSTSVPAPKGVAFTSLSLLEAGTGYALTASVAGLPPVQSQTFDITADPAAFNGLFLTTDADSVTAGTPVTVTVSALDTNANPVVDYAGTVHFASSVAEDVLPADFTFTPEARGRYTFTFLPTRATAHDLRVEDGPHGARTRIHVQAGPTAQLGFSRPISDRRLGESVSAQVRTQDAYGNPTITRGYIVSLSINKGTMTGGGGRSMEYGVATFGLTIDEPGSGYQLTANSPDLPSVQSNGFTITPEGGAIRMSTAIQSRTMQAGTQNTLTVRMLDRFGNLDPGYTGTVFITSQDRAGIMPPPYQFTAADGGQKTFSFELRTANPPSYSWSVDVTDGRMYGGSSVTVQPAALTKVIFRTQPGVTAVGQKLRSIAVLLADDYDNAVLVDSPAITLALEGGDGSATLLGTLTQVPDRGLVLFTDLRVDRPGTDYRLTATAGTLLGAVSDPFPVVQ